MARPGRPSETHIGSGGAFTVIENGATASTEPDSDQEDSFFEFIDALGAEKTGYTLHAYRLPLNTNGQVIVNARAHQQVHLDSWPLDAMSYSDLLGTLKRDYMPLDKPGTVMPVRLLIFKNGSRGVQKNSIVSVQKSVTPEPTNKENQRESIAEMIRMMQENTNQQIQQFRAALLEGQQRFIHQPPAPQKDPMEIAMQMMGVMSGFMNNMQRPAASPGVSGIKETLEVMTAVRDFLPDSPGREKKDDGIRGVLKDVAPFAQLLLQNKQEQQTQQTHQPILPGAPAATPQAPSPARPPTLAEQRAAYGLGPAPNPQAEVVTAVSPNKVPQNQQTQTPEGQNPMLSNLHILCNMADQNIDPKAAGEEVLKYIPEEMDDAIYDLVSDPKCVQKMTIAEPRVLKHSAWFEALRVSILASYDDPDEAEGQAGAAGG